MTDEAKILLQQVNVNLKEIIHKLESAFPKDEEGNTDYVGHRNFHKDQKDSAKQYKDSKAAIFRNILTWAAIGIATIILNSMIDGKSLPFLQAITKITH